MLDISQLSELALTHGPWGMLCVYLLVERHYIRKATEAERARLHELFEDARSQTHQALTESTRVQTEMTVLLRDVMLPLIRGGSK